MKYSLKALIGGAAVACSLCCASAHAQAYNVAPSGTSDPYYVVAGVNAQTTVVIPGYGTFNDDPEQGSGYLQQTAATTESISPSVSDSDGQGDSGDASGQFTATAELGDLDIQSASNSAAENQANASAGGWSEAGYGDTFTVTSNSLSPGTTAKFELIQTVEASATAGGSVYASSGVLEEAFDATLASVSYGINSDPSYGTPTETEDFTIDVGQSATLWSTLEANASGGAGEGFKPSNDQSADAGLESSVVSLTPGVSFTPVPESSTFGSFGVLLMLAAGGLLVARRRKPVS